MQSKITRRAVLAGVPAAAAAAVLPAIPALAAPQQDPIAALGRQWLAAKKQWSHWNGVEDELSEGSPEHKKAYRLFKKADDEMQGLEGMIIDGQATTVAGLLARWEIIEWLSDLDQEPRGIAMRADLERVPRQRL